MKGNLLPSKQDLQEGRGTETDKPCVGKLKPAPLKTKGMAPDEGNLKGGGRWRLGLGNLIARGVGVCYAARESSPVEGVSNGIL
jgi:hypothetical protein